MNAHRKKSLADVTRYKGRTLLVVIAIFIGVFGLTCIRMTENTLASTIAFSVGDQTLQPDILMAVNKLDITLLPQLNSVSTVKVVQYETTLTTLWHVQRAPGYVTIKITSYPDPQHISLSHIELVSGRYPRAGEIVMEYGDKGIQDINIGDKVTIDTTQGSTKLLVVGLVRTAGSNPAVSDNAQAYMSNDGIAQLPAVTTLDSPHRDPTRLQFIAVKTSNITQVETTAMSLQNILQGHNVKILLTGFPTVSTLSWNQFSGLFTLLNLLVLLAIIISTILMFNTVTMLITEQTAIIGTMKTIGGTSLRILLGYLLTVGIYCLAATLPAIILGTAAGFFLASMIAATIPLAPGPLTIPLDLIALSLLVGFGVPLGAALLPIWNGIRISIRDALSAYRVQVPDSKGILTKLHFGSNWPSQTVQLGLRSLFRTRWRTTLVLLTLSIAGMSFLTIQIVTTSVNNTVGSAYNHLSGDVEVDTENTSFSQIHTQLSALPNVTHVERYGAIGATTIWGRVQVWGFDPTTQLYHYQLTSGRWFRPGDTNTVLLSDDMVQRSGLHTGNTFTMTNQRGQPTTWIIVGTVQQTVDSFGLVGATIVPVETLYQFQGVPTAVLSDAAQRILIETQDHSQQALNQLTDKIGAIALSSNSKGAGIVNVFLLQNEVIRQQRSWFGIYGLFYVVALIIGIVGILGLTNELTASVMERRREIGILRSIGGSSLRITQMFWVQGLALGCIAWCIGALLGTPLAYLFLQLFSRLIIPTQFVVNPIAFILMLVGIVVIATLASIAPALQASRMRIANMLRYE